MADETFPTTNTKQPHHRQNHQQQQNHVMLHGQQQQQSQISQIPQHIPQVRPHLPHSSPLDRFIHNKGGLSLSLPLQNPAANPSPQQQELAARVPPAAKTRADVSTPGGHGRDDAWTESATVALIEAWGERYLQLNRGNLKQKHWREVADEVNRRTAIDDNPKGTKTDVQCKNRLDTLKKKYKIEKARLVSDGSPSKWPFFLKLDELVGPSKKGKKRPAPSGAMVVANGNANPNGNLKKPDETQQKAQAGTSNSSSSKEFSAGMTDSNEENGAQNQAPNTEGKCKTGKKRKAEGPFKELARAIVKFGEVYERVESAKQQQMMELERQRMEFTKDLELQRMQLFMQMQVELAKMKHGKHGNNTEHYL